MTHVFSLSLSLSCNSCEPQCHQIIRRRRQLDKLQAVKAVSEFLSGLFLTEQRSQVGVFYLIQSASDSSPRRLLTLLGLSHSGAGIATPVESGAEL